ncbi:UNVERIFIED_CONTAM: hypothetical protein HDU68_004296 [Siphonaria sp. JEL0065]|nr:hypothetical protein HDU68_004296 [Siphonaria sp. JEL0065]
MSILLTVSAIFCVISSIAAFPDLETCVQMNWDLGEGSDPNPGFIQEGQQVYIQDEKNFCINLPDPNSSFLKENYGGRPTIVQAEGYVHAFCVGDKLTPGASPMPQGGIISAHVVKNYKYSGQRYMQIWGKMNCDILNINCRQSSEGMFDDGGQYDSVRYRNCGKEPYSGVDPVLQGGGDAEFGRSFDKYVEQVCKYK